MQAANSSQHTSLPSAAMSPESVRFELPQDAVLVECGSHLFLDVVVDGAKAADQELGNNHQRERPGLKAYMEGLAAVFLYKGFLSAKKPRTAGLRLFLLGQWTSLRFEVTVLLAHGQHRSPRHSGPCEWNKHMDHHKRPDVSNHTTCEQDSGFI